ncbi:hypothetical protein [uncultured Kordia sp.]|uniref:hypothetical protein n=1 Tax=uncultured Kordia sp. TaxID=507699 RepID=UPI002621B802|nr:hypothetical protein [uncultured Kordia sp.]
MKKKLPFIAILILPFLIFAQTYVPDDNFEQALIDLGYDSGPLDDFVPTANISGVINLDITQKNISDLTGIADFAALEEIRFSQNQIQTIDFTSNTNLTFISAYTGDLTSIDITGLTNLEEIYLQLHDLTSLDISTNTALRILHCNGNDITSMNVSNNTLVELDCSGNDLATLDLSNTPALKVLRIAGNLFQTIDLSHNTELTLLNLYGTPVVSLDVSNNSLLEYLYVNFSASNQTTLEELDLSNNPALKILRAQSIINLRSLNLQNGNNTAITTFVVTNTPALSCIEVDDAAYSTSNWTAVDASVTFSTDCDPLSTDVPDDNFEQALIDLGYDFGPLDDIVLTANISGITTLDVSSKNIADLTGIEDFTALQTLYCNDNQLTSLDVQNNLQLADLRCNDNQLTNVDLSSLLQLQIFSATNNQLSSVDISNNSSLLAIAVTENNLTALNTSNNPLLIQIICGQNQLMSLDVSSNPDLIDLYCYQNQLTTIDVTSNSILEVLWCRSNQLTSINTTGINTLKTYVAYDNQLNAIDVSTNSGLELLSLGNNNLSTVDVSANSSLTELYAQANQLNSLDVSANAALETLWVFNNAIPVLNLSNNINLQVVDIGTNDYASLDLSSNAQLTEVYVQNCPNLEVLNLKNGANPNLTNFLATGNPNLSCIEVDDPATSTANWSGVDAGTVFSIDCNYDLIYVPDDAFEQALINLGYDTAPLDDYIPMENINTVTTLDISNLGIADMTGIEGFIALEELNCSGNSIENLQITANTLLTNLDVNDNLLSELNISTNLALEMLNVSNNALTTIDLNNHTQLTSFDGSYNNFILLLIKNGNNSNMTNFAATNNPDLTCIEVDDVAYSTTNWTAIDTQTSFNTDCNQFYTYVPDDRFEQALIDLGYDSGPLNDYVLTANINTITVLNVTYKGITDLTGINDFTALVQLDCGYNALSSIDIRGNANLEILDCRFNAITSIDVTNNAALRALSLWSNDFTEIDVNNNAALEYLDVESNNITALNLSLNTQLTQLYCSDNNLERLNVKNGNNENFTTFFATQNDNLTCVEVDNAEYSTTNWTDIDAHTNFNENCTYDFTYVPDDAFEQALINLGYDTAPLDDFVPKAAIEVITTLDISNLGITDLTGIEDFTALQELNCSSNALGTLDVRNNLNLTNLNCASNVLTTLDILANENLISLNVNGNMLSALNIINNSLLESVNISNNNIMVFNVNFHVALNELYADNNALQMLNVKNGNNTNFVGFSAIGNPSLTCIQVDDATWSATNWTSIDVQTSFNEDCGYATYVPDDNFEQALIDLGYDSGPLDDFVPTANINPGTTLNIDISSKGIVDMTGIEAFSTLLSLDCSNNAITNLNVSNNSILNYLKCDYNDLTYLNTNTPSLAQLYCNHNELTALDLSNNPDLFILDAKFNDIENLDVSVNTKLRDVDLQENQLTTLDFSTHTLLEDLRCHNNRLRNLNIGNSPILQVLVFSDNKLAAIDLRSNINLEFIIGQRNFLSELDLSANVKLETLAVSGNDFTSIDLTNNILLDDLSIPNNYINELSLDTNVNLERLTCFSNELKTLDLSMLPNLNYMYVSDNELTSLNVQNGNNANVTFFRAATNDDLYCVLVDNAAYSTTNWTQIDAQTSFNETSCDYIELSAKVLLQGASLGPNVGEENLMRDDLRVNGLISATSPYGDGAMISELVRTNDNAGNSMVDWIWVELRDKNNPTNVIAGKSGVLQRDGDIVDVNDDLTKPLTFDALPIGDYHIVIKHRNHLGVMTATSETLKQATTIVDFTNANNQITFGSNAQTVFGMQPNKTAMWAGNVNGDTMVQYSGTNPDTPTILSTVLNDPGNFLNFPTFAVTAYIADDLNMDGNIQYSGTNPDTPVILQNVLAHPGNFLNFSTFQITEQLPEHD